MSKDNYYNFYVVLIQGFICFVLNVLTRKILVGIGGKLGTLGFLSALPSIAISFWLNLGIEEKSYHVINIIWNTDYYAMVKGWILIFSVITATLSSILLHFVAELKVIKRHPAPRLVSYGINASFFGLLLILWNKYLGEVKTVNDATLIIKYGTYLLNYWHTGLFAAMTAKVRLSPLIRSDYISYAILGLMSGFYNFAMSGFLLVGGKHGFSALLSSITYVLGFRIASKLSKRLGYKHAKTSKSKRLKLLSTQVSKV